jgi:hypothetical protein
MLLSNNNNSFHRRANSWLLLRRIRNEQADAAQSIQIIPGSDDAADGCKAARNASLSFTTFGI